MQTNASNRPTPRTYPILGVILAGGTSRRFGSNKAQYILHDGRTMMAHVIDRLLPQVDHMCIAGGQNADQYTSYDLPVLVDGAYTDCGPAAGLLAALDYAQGLNPKACVAVCPCDTPDIPLTLFADLFTGLKAAHAAYAVISDDHHYAHCILQLDCLPRLKSALDEGHRSLRHMHEMFKSTPVSLNDPSHMLSGHNTPPARL